MLTVFIAEDDSSMRHVLKRTLEQIPGTKVLGEAGDGVTALKMIEKLRPRVVFIDIDLPEKNGVDLAREICDIDPQILLIFATAYDDYTHEAFEVYAFDYLVKPFKLDRVKKTLERINQMDLQRASAANYFHPPVAGEITPPRLVLRQNEKLLFLDTQEVILITRENRKTILHTTKQRLETTETLNDIEKRLTGSSFFRSHRGYIVNLSLIKEIYPWGKKGYQITFSGTKETALLTNEKFKELEKRLLYPETN